MQNQPLPLTGFTPGSSMLLLTACLMVLPQFIFVANQIGVFMLPPPFHTYSTDGQGT